MSGLDPRFMQRSLNGIAQRVMAGKRLAPGDVLEGVIGRVPVVIERLSDSALRETVTYSGWFHRRKPEAFVIVWPSTSALFPWQPGAPDILTELQPPQWRDPVEHSGGVAVDPAWLFPVPADRMAFSCKHVLEEADVIRWVARERDEVRGEDWSMHCGADDHGTDDMALVHIAHLARSHPSVVELHDLELDEQASRADVDSPWQREGLA